MKRTLRLRKEVLIALSDAELELMAGGGPEMPLDSFPTLCQRTCLTCYWTCLCFE